MFRFKRELAAAFALGAAFSRKKTTRRIALLGAAGAVLLWPRRLAAYSGKSVVITGGSRGLGFAMARECVQIGAAVTVLARDADELARAEQALGAPENLLTIVCDVTDEGQIEDAFAKAFARFGKVDVLINNAGSILVAPFDALEDLEFRAQLDLHLHAVIHATRLVRPYFGRCKRGQIINISSIGGLIPCPHLSAYVASKFALAGFSETMAIELADENIRVLTAYPGLMRTGSAIQAVFKGDAEQEFDWFAASDNTPLITVAARSAARQILAASLAGRTQIILSWPAQLGALAHAIFPELTLALETEAHRWLPKGKSRQRATGANFRGDLTKVPVLDKSASQAESELNQTMKFDADQNLGLH